MLRDSSGGSVAPGAATVTVTTMTRSSNNNKSIINSCNELQEGNLTVEDDFADELYDEMSLESMKH